jgi:hypothetical protein
MFEILSIIEQYLFKSVGYRARQKVRVLDILNLSSLSNGRLGVPLFLSDCNAVESISHHRTLVQDYIRN